MKAYKVDYKNGNFEYWRFQKDIAKLIGITPKAIQKQFRIKGYYENKNYKVNKIEIL